MNFLAWLEQTNLSVWLREAPTLWAFPFVLFLHTLGLAIVAGLAVALNVRVLAFAGRWPSQPLRVPFRIAWLGFTINLVSGLLLLVAYPTKALTDPVFYVKMALILLAVGQLEWLRRRVAVMSPRSKPRDFRPRLAAAAAIVLWGGAILTGRLLAYTYRHMTAADLLAGF